MATAAPMEVLQVSATRIDSDSRAQYPVAPFQPRSLPDESLRAWSAVLSRRPRVSHRWSATREHITPEHQLHHRSKPLGSGQC